jgi:hypothetical protein
LTSRTPFEALESYARPISVALLCVTEARLTGYTNSLDTVFSLGFRTDPVVVRRAGGSPTLFFSFIQRYSIQPIQGSSSRSMYRVQTTYRDYGILDQHHNELISYHWHPRGVSTTTIPHFHVGSTILDTTGHEMGKTFLRLHLPSGHVSIADVARVDRGVRCPADP